MKIAIHSDLHFEFCSLSEDMLSNTDFDVLVLAGDIAPVGIRLGICFAEIRARVGPTKPILYVAGNHDYYRCNWGRMASNAIKQICDMNDIIWLNRDSVLIKDVRFSGATGWSTMDSVSGERTWDADRDVSYGIADFRAIDLFDLETMVDEGKQDRIFFENVRKDEYKSVFISHFSPLVELGNDKFPVGRMSNYFCNNYADIIYEKTPNLWIYGHTHGNIEKKIYETPCVTNQKGYNKECEGRYNPNYIIEI